MFSRENIILSTCNIKIVSEATLIMWAEIEILIVHIASIYKQLRSVDNENDMILIYYVFTTERTENTEARSLSNKAPQSA